MSILIIGGDKIESISKSFMELGASKLKHINGRRNSDSFYPFPQNIDVVVVLTKFLNHNLMYKYRDRAKELGIPLIFANNKSEIHTQWNAKFKNNY